MQVCNGSLFRRRLATLILKLPFKALPEFTLLLRCGFRLCIGGSAHRIRIVHIITCWLV